MEATFPLTLVARMASKQIDTNCAPLHHPENENMSSKKKGQQG